MDNGLTKKYNGGPKVSRYRSWILGYSMRFLLFVSLVGCVEVHPHPPACNPTSAPIPLDAPTSLGFSPDELVDELVTMRARWAIAWVKPDDADPQVLDLEVVDVGAASVVQFERPEGDEAMGCPSDEVEVALELEVTSSDGLIQSRGPAVLRGRELGAPFANLVFGHAATFGAEITDRIEAAVPAGAAATSMELWSGSGSVGINVSWDGPDATGWETVYRCDYDGVHLEGVTNCLDMSAP